MAATVPLDELQEKLSARLAELDANDGIRVVTCAASALLAAQLRQRSIRVSSHADVADVLPREVDAVLAQILHDPQHAVLLAAGPGCHVGPDTLAHAHARAVSVVLCPTCEPAEIAQAVRNALKKRAPKGHAALPRFLAFAGDVPCAFALWHRPTSRQVSALARDCGVTHVVTLLCAREKPEDIRQACASEGIVWLHIPLDGAHVARLGGALVRVYDALVSAFHSFRAAPAGSRVVFHCAAGIHRTGVVAYCMARLAGLSCVDALDALFAMRAHTGRGVGVDRLMQVEWLLSLSVADRAQQLLRAAATPADNECEPENQGVDA